MQHFIFIFVIIVLSIPVMLFMTSGYKRGERVTMLKILIAALIVRLGLIFLFSMTVNLKTIAPDSVRYTDSGVTTAKYWKGYINYNPYKSLYDLSKDNVGYYYVCAYVFYVFGDSSLYIPAYLNTFLGIITLLMFANLLRDFFAWKLVRNIIVLAAFFPSIVLWNSFPLKDSVVMFLVMSSFYYYLKFFKQKSPHYLFLSFLALFLLYFFRFYLVIIIIGIFFLTIVLMMGELSLSKIIKSIIAGIFILMFIFVSSIGDRILAKVQENANVEMISKIQSGLNSGKSRVTYGEEYNSGTDIIKYLPIRIIIFMFAPFPWQITSFNSALTMIEMPFWWLMLPLWLKGFKFLFSHKHVRQFLPLLLYTIFLSLFYSILEGNIGTAYRMRAQVLPFFFVMTVVGWAINKTKQLNVSTKYLLSPVLREQN